jgi:phage/plasmid-like protein (TIGR03299 family)
VLGVVGSKYVPIQNRDAFTTFDSLVGEGEAIYHTAGALGKGERIWILAKLPDYIRVNGNDLVEKFLLLTNSHDGSGAVRVKLTPIRVVCENTLAMALSGIEEEVRIWHIAHADEKLKKAQKILGLTNKLYSELENIFNGMSAKKMTQAATEDYVKAIFPTNPQSNGHSRMPAIQERVLELVETGRGAVMAKGTLWGAFNAVTEFVDHCRLASATDSNRLKSIWFGSGERIKKEAFRNASKILS